MAKRGVQLQVGQEYQGFQVKRITPLANLRSTAYEIEHLRSGARILHVHAPHDAENLFSIAFPTPPADDTGLPHILEHSVLGGSRRYPVKDPFVEMLKMSMATFINAMTYDDKTVYPVASNVEQDFYNLAEVYCDAVFHPNLTENTLRQEGHHLELARKGDLSSELTIKGIVYNEMKGVYSSADSLVYRHAYNGLFPDTPYGRESGGDPEHIPELTYRQFKRFHRKFYHPSNSYMFIYGDLPTSSHLKFLRGQLKGFSRIEIDVRIPRQPRWTAPRERSISYPIGPADETKGKTFLTLSWLVGDGTDPQDVVAFSVLQLILLGHHGAPLYKALIDSRLGEDLSHSGYSAGTLESIFCVGLKGSEPERRDAFVQLVLDTLGKIADEGIPDERVATALQQIAYRYLEIESMFPLWLMDRAYSTWIYGADPLLFLRADERIAEFKERLKNDPQLFSRLIRERLLENPHRLTLVCEPDRELQARKDAAFAKRMEKLKARLGEEKLRELDAQASELEKLQSQPNSPEALATLPQLKVSDLPRKPKHIPTTVETEGHVTFLHNDVFANGVNYLHVDLDVAALPEDLYPYMPLYAACFRKMGAAGQSYVQIAERIASLTGGVHLQTSTSSHAQDPSRILRHTTFTVKTLDERAPEALRLLRDLAYDLDLRDVARLKDVVVQTRAAHRSGIVRNGMELAIKHACRGLNAECALDERMGGVPQTRLVEKLAADFDARRDELIARLERIRDFLRAQGAMTVSFTGSAPVYERMRRELPQWVAGKSPAVGAAPAISWEPFAVPPREGLAYPMDIAYCVQAMPGPHLSHPDCPALSVASRLLSLGYCWEEIRVKGGAYGGGCRYSGWEQTFHLQSYRDPAIKRTLEVYDALRDHVARADWTQTDIDRAIIGTAKDGERPIRPGAATGAALWRHVTGDTKELREARHEGVLRATPAELKRAVLELLDANRSRAAVCVVSSREKLEHANREMPDAPLSVEDILGVIPKDGLSL